MISVRLISIYLSHLLSSNSKKQEGWDAWNPRYLIRYKLSAAILIHFRGTSEGELPWAGMVGDSGLTWSGVRRSGITWWLTCTKRCGYEKVFTTSEGSNTPGITAWLTDWIKCSLTVKRLKSAKNKNEIKNLRKIIGNRDILLWLCFNSDYLRNTRDARTSGTLLAAPNFAR